MTDSDSEQFATAWSALSEVLSGSKQSDAAIALAFSVLRDYPLEAVLGALSTHAKTQSWMPAPADVINLISTPAPKFTSKDLLGLARAGNTPLGVWVRYLVTAFSLDTWTDHQLITHIDTRRIEIDDFIDKASRGELTNTQRHVLERHSFDALTPLAPGLPAPAAGMRSMTVRTCTAISA